MPHVMIFNKSFVVFRLANCVCVFIVTSTMKGNNINPYKPQVEGGGGEGGNIHTKIHIEKFLFNN